MTDQEIIYQLKKGDESSLKHLYVHLDKVKGWVRQNNGNDEDALDLFQEAIIVFYRKVMADEYELNAKISTYLFGIARNQWLNQLNRRKRFEKTGSSEAALEKEFEEDLIEMTRRGPTLKKYLKEALEQLGDPCKSLLEASIVLGMKMEEIAKKFNYADARSASQQKLRCLKRLRSRLSYDVIIRLE